MSNSFATSSLNSTIVRARRTGWTLLRVYFAVASRFLPEVARRQAERLFTLPPRYAGRRPHPIDARREAVTVDGRSLAV